MSKNCRNVEDMLNRYLDDELSASRRRDLDRELKEDPALRDVLNGYRRILKSLRAFRRVKFPPERLRQARAIIMQRVAALS